MIGSTASATAEPGGGYTVRIAAADLGTGARTVLSQVAADALGVPLAEVRVLIGDSGFGPAVLAGGSMGTASWSWAVVEACRALTDQLAAGAAIPAEGLTAQASTAPLITNPPRYASHAYGAHFAEVAVDVGSGEIRVPRLLGVFAAGARLQRVGAEVHYGLRVGDFLNHDLANYHLASTADVGSLEVAFVEEAEDHLNPLGVKGIGEISIVGVAAAVANAVWHATGVRHRSIPIRPDHVLTAEAGADPGAH